MRSDSTRLIRLAGTLLAGATFALCLGFATSAHADDGLDVDVGLSKEILPNGIYQGSAVQGCGWPTTVAVFRNGNLCSGTLIHERVVTYAAHCGGGTKDIIFGNTLQSLQRITTNDCVTYPNYGGVNDQAHDWAYCVLPEPMTDIPITPPVMGCEGTNYLTDGKQVAIVGFGQTHQGVTGTKHWSMTTLHGVIGAIANVGGAPNAGICPGDSGGPAYVQYDDGSWHAFGIASTVQGGCGGLGTHALIPAAVGWIEEQTGIDVTPCHTVNGNWDATHRCTGFSLEGPNGSGEWSQWCPGTPESGSSSECGAAFDAEPDPGPPFVEILHPIHNEMYVPQEDISIDINADDGAGWGIARAWVSIEGMDQPDIEYAPYSYPKVQFPQGKYTLIGHAEDAAGNLAESVPVTIWVGLEPEPEPESTSGSDTGATATGTGGDTDDPSAGTSVGMGTEGTDSEGTKDGCGCTSSEGSGGELAGLGMLVLLGLTRRRRR